MDWRLEEHARQMRLRSEHALARLVMDNEIERAGGSRSRARSTKKVEAQERRRAAYLKAAGRTEDWYSWADQVLKQAEQQTEAA